MSTEIVPRVGGTPIKSVARPAETQIADAISFTSKRRDIRRLLLSVVTLLAFIVMTACGVSSTPRGELAQDKRILASCDKAARPASDVEIDGTGSSASKQITDERMTAIESIVRTTVICSGRLRVSVFSSSSAATATFFEGPLRLDGATSNARLKRVPGVVGDVMATIRKAYDPAVARLDRGGSDISAQFRLASEWSAQLGSPFRLHLYVLTDGFQTIGVNLDAKALSRSEAVALADRVTMPRLPRAFVVVAGLGRVAGAPPHSDVVEGLVAYYTELCRRSGAAQCRAVTDYTPEGP
jgi:hypothetical protein